MKDLASKREKKRKRKDKKRKKIENHGGRYLILASGWYKQDSLTHKKAEHNTKCRVVLKALFIFESIQLKNSQEATTVCSGRDDLPKYSL